MIHTIVAIYVVAGVYVLWTRKRIIHENSIKAQEQFILQGNPVGLGLVKFLLCVATVFMWPLVLIGKWQVRNEKNKR